MMQFLKETSPPTNLVLKTFYKTKKLVKKLGFVHKKINCYIKSCMLYYKDDINEMMCKFYNKPRFKELRQGRGRYKEVPFRIIYFLLLIHRLQWLYASIKLAEHIWWHHDHQIKDNVLQHPSYGEAWKHFDKTYLNFTMERRNVQHCLCFMDSI